MSQVGTTFHSNYRPVCSRCQGTSFRAKRSAAGKMVAGALAAKTRLKCNGCGAEYDRDRVPKTYVSQVVSGPAATAGHTQAAGWYPDPLGRHELRWWGGMSWMDAVRDGDVQDVDPVDPPEAPARTVADELRDLAALRDEGILSEDEFEAQKARLLG
jgi:hypothetical protein